MHNTWEIVACQSNLTLWTAINKHPQRLGICYDKIKHVMPVGLCCVSVCILFTEVINYYQVVAAFLSYYLKLVCTKPITKFESFKARVATTESQCVGFDRTNLLQLPLLNLVYRQVCYKVYSHCIQQPTCNLITQNKYQCVITPAQSQRVYWYYITNQNSRCSLCNTENKTLIVFVVVLRCSNSSMSSVNEHHFYSRSSIHS